MSLIDLICENNVAEVKQMIKEGRVEPSEYEENFLVFAVKYASVEMLKLLWDYSPKHNPYSDEDGWSLLHYALNERKFETGKYLVSKLVPIDHVDVHGLKAIDYVPIDEQEEVLKKINNTEVDTSGVLSNINKEKVQSLCDLEFDLFMLDCVLSKEEQLDTLNSALYNCKIVFKSNGVDEDVKRYIVDIYRSLKEIVNRFQIKKNKHICVYDKQMDIIPDDNEILDFPF